MDANERTRKLEHYTKYLDYAGKIGVSFINSDNIDRLMQLVELGDTYFNRMSLRSWDGYHYAYVSRARGLEPGGWSIANSVCTAKVAALRDALIRITGEDIATAEELINALEALNEKGE